MPIAGLVIISRLLQQVDLGRGCRGSIFEGVIGRRKLTEFGGTSVSDSVSAVLAVDFTWLYY